MRRATKGVTHFIVAGVLAGMQAQLSVISTRALHHQSPVGVRTRGSNRATGLAAGGWTPAAGFRGSILGNFISGGTCDKRITHYNKHNKHKKQASKQNNRLMENPKQ